MNKQIPSLENPNSIEKRKVQMRETAIFIEKKRERIECGYEIYPVSFSYAYNVLRSKMIKEKPCSGKTA